jgi:hypothetical protein
MRADTDELSILGILALLAALVVVAYLWGHGSLDALGVQLVFVALGCVGCGVALKVIERDMRQL